MHCCCQWSSSLTMLREVYSLNPSAISTVDDRGQTPLLTFVMSTFRYSPAGMDMLNFLLKVYPEAASIPCDDDEDEDYSRRTPYEVCAKCHTHARRLLLRAAPALDPEALRELNYSARRMALFLFYLGSREDREESLFTKLSMSPKGQGLVRRIVSFL